MRTMRCADRNPVDTRTRLERSSAARMISALCLGIVLLAVPASANNPAARTGAEQSGPKAYWQERYRNLINRAAELRDIIETERELYADANRRNYRRGDKRHRHRIKLIEAEDQLEVIEAELETIKDDGRRAGALPGWFYEVESELEVLGGKPPVERGPGDRGRNPLYVEDEN